MEEQAELATHVDLCPGPSLIRSNKVNKTTTASTKNKTLTIKSRKAKSVFVHVSVIRT